MSDSPQTPKLPKPHLPEEYEDPHYHDDDEVAPIQDDEPHTGGKVPPRRKWTYRPLRRFEED
jgi:hypothetical protein